MPVLWKTRYDYDTDYSTTPPTKVAKPTYDGAVLGTWGRTERVMSDVWDHVGYARVWDGDKVANIAVGMGYDSYADVVVDATDAVKALAAAHAEVLAAAAAEREVAERLARARVEAARVARGKEVTVVRGRKVPKGTSGRVFWLGPTTWGTRVGLELADGSRVFTAVGNVEVALPGDLS